jgi:hypothetical protein
MSSLLTNPAFVSSYQVTRIASNGSWVQGRWVEGSSSTVLNITASVQRLTAKETQMLPEAYRTRSTYKVYSIEELKVITLPSRGADAITIEGSVYDIVAVEKWTQIYPHYRSIAVRREEVSL